MGKMNCLDLKDDKMKCMDRSVEELKTLFMSIFPYGFDRWFYRHGLDWSAKPSEFVRTGRIEQLFEYLERLKNSPNDREALWKSLQKK